MILRKSLRPKRGTSSPVKSPRPRSRHLRLDHFIVTDPGLVVHHSKSLKSLSLTRDQITTLPNKVFSGLCKLKELNLENNRLTTIPKEVFSGLSKLKTLDLQVQQAHWASQGGLQWPIQAGEFGPGGQQAHWASQGGLQWPIQAEGLWTCRKTSSLSFPRRSSVAYPSWRIWSWWATHWLSFPRRSSVAYPTWRLCTSGATISKRMTSRASPTWVPGGFDVDIWGKVPLC